MEKILRTRYEIEQRLVVHENGSHCAKYQGLCLKSAFQAIVDVNGNPFGYEALLRVHDSTGAPVDTALLFNDYQKQLHHLINLDRLARVIHLRNFSQFLSTSYLFINMSPITIIDGESQSLTSQLLLPRIKELGLQPEKIYVEILEHFYHDNEKLVRAIDSLRNCGLRIAVDDFGVQGSSEQRTRAIRPNIIKIDKSLLDTYIQGDSKSIFDAITVARDLKASVLIEGIENKAAYQAARMLGADYYQGYYTGRPQLIASMVDPYKMVMST
ncbi:EAL domain-containing protein [Photobacterium makurazakiensis]|uniref:EAL domain-containing protein n=1 Tax=Photobacterium makurazakiensis TaxID=2910234 RepID=UPI003D148D25